MCLSTTEILLLHIHTEGKEKKFLSGMLAMFGGQGSCAIKSLTRRNRLPSSDPRISAGTWSGSPQQVQPALPSLLWGLSVCLAGAMPQPEDGTIPRFEFGFMKMAKTHLAYR